jgi:hypothetical protein
MVVTATALIAREYELNIAQHAENQLFGYALRK